MITVFCAECRCWLRGSDRRCLAEHLLYRRAGLGHLLPGGVHDDGVAMGIVLQLVEHAQLSFVLSTVQRQRHRLW